MKMPTEKIDTAMFAPCGMNCLVCYKHCYHKKPYAGCPIVLFRLSLQTNKKP